MMVNCLIGKLLQFPGTHVFFDLLVPTACVELGEPLAESSQVIRRKLGNGHL
jgi:hypothetical protein